MTIASRARPPVNSGDATPDCTCRVEICKLLLKHKANPDDFERGGGYPIMAEAVDHAAVIKLLIHAGANVRRRITQLVGGSTGGRIIGDEATALHFAAQAGNVDSCRLLVAAGADVSAADTEGQTPLHVALRGEASSARAVKVGRRRNDLLR